MIHNISWQISGKRMKYGGIFMEIAFSEQLSVGCEI